MDNLLELYCVVYDFLQKSIPDSLESPHYNYQVVKDFSSSHSSQLSFVQAARNAACSNNNAYCMGADYRSWQQYIYDSSADSNYPLRGPNLPYLPTVSYLGSSASYF